MPTIDTDIRCSFMRSLKNQNTGSQTNEINNAGECTNGSEGAAVDRAAVASFLHEVYAP